MEVDKVVEKQRVIGFFHPEAIHVNYQTRFLFIFHYSQVDAVYLCSFMPYHVYMCVRYAKLFNELCLHAWNFVE